MLKIGRKASVTLSLVLTLIFLAGVIFGTFVTPRTVRLLIDSRDSIPGRAPVSAGGRTFILCIAYLILVTAALLGGLLLRLILLVRAGEVFTSRTVALLRGISWLCIFAAPMFAVLGRWFFLSFSVSFVAAFVGLCLRVVKNAFEEAVAIKDENDYTI